MSASASRPRLFLIGEARLAHGAGGVLLLEHKDALLLAYLAIEGPTPRQTVAGWLWPEVDQERANANLRQRLYRLRKTLGFDLLSGGLVVSVAAQVQVDLAAGDDGSGELLSAVTEIDAGALAQWLTDARQHRRSRQCKALALESTRLEASGQLERALAAAQRLLQFDTTSESAHRQVIRLHYLRNDRSAALLAFDHCEQVLKDEAGARPSAETLALLLTIEQAEAPAWTIGQPLPASVLRPPRMIGRHAESAQVQSAWAAAEVFVVTGHAGLGKSRLLGELFDARVDVALLRARPGDDAVPLATLVRLAHSLAARWPAVGASAAYARLLELASGSGLDPHGAIRSAVPIGADLLRAAEACGLRGVVLDDLQFADEASVDTWHEWLDRPGLAHLRFGFASRVGNHAAEERIERLRQRSDVITIAVPQLEAAQTEALVASLALAGTDVAAVSAALAHRIGGNPLHLLETIRRALEQHGALLADRLDTPAQVLDLIEQRLRALSVEGLLLVRIAAVAGSDFDPELAQSVSRRDVLELADAWSALERQGILDVRGFAHDLMLEAALRLLPQPIRRVIHGRVAECIAGRGAPPARLAHHWLEAGEPVTALPHLVSAARLAWRAGRGRETRDAFFKAAGVEVSRGQPDIAFDLLFECAEAVARLCPVAAFDEVIARLVPLARTASHAARIALVKAGSLFLHGDHEGSTRGMADALLLAIACGDRMVEAECIYEKGYCAFAEGRLRDAVEQFSVCATLQRSSGLERLALVTDASKLVALRRLGQVRPALDEQQRAMPWLINHGDPVDLATSRLEQVLDQLDLGDVSAADAGAQPAWQAIRDTDMRGAELCRNASSMLRFHRRRGSWTQALAVSGEVLERLAAQGEDAGELAFERAEIYLDLGRPELARPYIEMPQTAPLQHLRWSSMALRWRYLSAAGAPVDLGETLAQALRSEQFPQACELMLAAGQSSPSQLRAEPLNALVAGCEARGLQMHLLPLLALQAWLLAREGDLKAAAASARKAQSALPGADLGAALPACGLWLANALLCLGREREATAVSGHASGWIAQRVVDSVPAEFHESFRSRNPVHRDLLALVQQLRG